jgi:hypothetical protein
LVTYHRIVVTLAGMGSEIRQCTVVRPMTMSLQNISFVELISPAYRLNGTNTIG